MWNSLRVTQLIVGAVTPAVVMGLEQQFSVGSRRLEQTDWANRVPMQRRLDLYEEMTSLPNDLYCSFGWWHFVK